MVANPDRHARRLQEAQALELLRRGNNSREIAVILNVSRATANRRIRKGLDGLGAETSERLRASVEDRLNDMLRRSYDLLDRAEDDRSRLAVIKTIATIERDRARLLGLNVPASLILQIERSEHAG
jgi:DNA-binding NarL/FixJ family response regulator